MTRLYRLLKIAKLYSQAMAEKDGWRYITEGDIYGIIKNIPNVMMVPNSYSVDTPSGATRQPWGPTVTFDYLFSGLKPKDENFVAAGKGDPRVIKKVQDSITAIFQRAFQDYIQDISTQYNGDGLYTVTITQKIE